MSFKERLIILAIVIIMLLIAALSSCSNRTMYYKSMPDANLKPLPSYIYAIPKLPRTK